jgi:hypothetical protein
MGSHKKPQALREVSGTANRNKHRDNQDQPKVTIGIGPAPSHFTEQQVEIWDYLVSVMFAGVLSRSDRPTLEMMAVLFYRFRHGTYDEDTVCPVLNGVELSRLDSLMGRYGMTPSDRTKIVVPKQPDHNPFEDMK